MRTHLSQREYSALQTLFAMVSGFEVCVGLLEKRSAEAGCAEEMRQVSAMAQGCMDKILRTVPENKLMHILADLGNIRLITKIEPPGLRSNPRQFGYVPRDALNDLLNHLCQTECSMCDKTAVESRKCQWRRLIEDSLPHDVDGKDREHCKYSDMVLGLEAV